MNNHKKTNHNNSFEKIAKKEGITPEEVHDEIARAISYAMQDSDPKVQALWKTIPCEGDSPTVEEVIDFVSSMIAKDL